MNIGTQARADRRVLISASLLGSGLGLALGAVYLAGGLSAAAADHARAARVAQAAGGAYSEAVLQQEAADPSVQRLARAHDPQAAEDVQGRQLQLLSAQLRGAQADAGRPDPRPKAARDLDCLTDAVYFESRGETQRGQQAVATVVLNRVKNPHFPKSVCSVVFQRAGHGCQFSFACDGSMRHGRDEDAWVEARRVAAHALAGYVLRDVGSATHFHTVDVSPDWGSQMLKVAQVGLHVFYRRNPHAPVDPTPEAEPQQAVFTATPGQPQPPLRVAVALVQPAPDAGAPAKASAPAKAQPEATKSPSASLSKVSDPGEPKAESSAS